MGVFDWFFWNGGDGTIGRSPENNARARRDTPPGTGKTPEAGKCSADRERDDVSID